MLFDLLRFSLNDGPGIRTSVFLKGCPLRCRWCHNPESQSPLHQVYLNGSKTIGFEMEASQVIEIVKKDSAYYKHSCGGITITGGEPLFQPEFTLELLKLSKQLGIHTVIETSGYGKREDLEEISLYTDLFLYDYKGSEKLHKALTGVENTLIVDNLEFLCGKHANVILRCPIIPGVNDDEQARKEFLMRFPELKGCELLPYHSMGEGKAQALGLTYYGDQPL